MILVSLTSCTRTSAPTSSTLCTFKRYFRGRLKTPWRCSPLIFRQMDALSAPPRTAPARQFKIMTLFSQDLVVLGRDSHLQIVMKLYKLAQSHYSGFFQNYVCTRKRYCWMNPVSIVETSSLNCCLIVCLHLAEPCRCYTTLNFQKCNNHLVSFIKHDGLFVSYIVHNFFPP